MENEDKFAEEYEAIWKHCDTESDIEWIVLKAHLVSESYMDRFFDTFFMNGKKLVDNGNLTYRQKLVLSKALAYFPDDMLDCLDKLNLLRNKLTHDLEYQISIEDVELIGCPLGKYYSELKRKRSGGTKDLLIGVLGFVVGGMAHRLVDYQCEIECRIKMAKEKSEPIASADGGEEGAARN
jgi:hypothetical protein